MRLAQIVAWVFSLLITASLFAGVYMYLNRLKLPSDPEEDVKTLDELHDLDSEKSSSHELPHKEEHAHEETPAKHGEEHPHVEAPAKHEAH